MFWVLLVFEVCGRAELRHRSVAEEPNLRSSAGVPFDKAVEAWLEHAPVAPAEPAAPADSLMETTSKMGGRPTMSGSLTGQESCYGHADCQNIKDTNRQETQDANAKLNSMNSQANNARTGAVAAYQAEYNTDNREMASTYSAINADNTYEWNTHVGMASKFNANIQKIMDPVIMKFNNYVNLYHTSHASIKRAQDQHDAEVTEKKAKFDADNAADTKKAVDYSADKEIYYSGDDSNPSVVQVAEQFAEDETNDANDEIYKNGNTTESLKLGYDEVLSQVTDALQGIDANIADLSTQVEEAQTDHESKVQDFVDGHTYMCASADGKSCSETDISKCRDDENCIVKNVVVSFDSMIEDGERIAEDFEEKYEDKNDEFVDEQETLNSEMEKGIFNQALISAKAGEKTQEEVAGFLQNQTTNFSNYVTEYENEVEERQDRLNKISEDNDKLVSAVQTRVKQADTDISDFSKRMSPIADKMLKTTEQAITAAKKASQQMVQKEKGELEREFKSEHAVAMANISAEKKDLIDTSSKDIEGIVDNATSFVFSQRDKIPAAGGADSVKSLQQKLATVATSVDAGADVVADVKSKVAKERKRSVELKELESAAEKVESDTKKGIGDTKNEIDVAIQKSKLANGKVLQKAQGLARDSIASVRDEVGTKISEVAETKLGITESMVSKAFAAATELKGEVAQANSAAFEAAAQLEWNGLELARLKSEAATKEQSYLEDARDVKTNANVLKGTLSTPIETALEAARQENGGSLTSSETTLEKEIETSAAAAEEQINALKTQVIAASAEQGAGFDKRAAKETALKRDIGQREEEMGQVENLYHTSFGGVEAKVAAATATMNQIMGSTELQLTQHTAAVNGQIAATQSSFANQAGSAFSSFSQAMANLRTDYAQSVHDAGTNIDQTVDQDSHDTQNAADGASGALQEQATGVAQLQGAADSPVGADAVNSTEAAAALVDGAAAAADDAVVAAEGSIQTEASALQDEFSTASGTSDNQVNTIANGAAHDLQDLSNSLGNMFGLASDDADNAANTANSVESSLDDEISGEEGEIESASQEEQQEAAEDAAALNAAAVTDAQTESLENQHITGLGNEAENEAHRANQAAGAAAAGLNSGQAIVNEEVNAVDQEEKTRIEKLDPTPRLEKMSNDLKNLKADLEGQTDMTETEIGNVDELASNLNRAANLQVPEIRKQMGLLKPGVLERPKATMDKLEKLRMEMNSVFNELGNREHEVSSQAESADLLFATKEEKLKHSLEKTEGDLVEAMEMAQYQSADAMHRVADIVHTGLASDKALNEEVQTNVQPTTDTYRWKINNVYNELGIKIDMDEVMNQANQSMEEEMKLRDRLSGSGEDLESYIAQAQKLAKSKIDQMYNKMLAEIAATMHDASLTEYQKMAKIAMLKEQAKAERAQLSTQVNDLAGTQFEEMRSIDDKKQYAQTLAQRAASAARGDPSKFTRGQMAGFFQDLRLKIKDVDDKYNGDLSPGSLLETDIAGAGTRADAVDEFTTEERALHHLHDREESDVNGWMSELKEMGAQAI